MPKLKFALLFAISFVSSSCVTKVEISDSEVCADLGPHGAYCSHMFSDNEREISKEDWEIERYGQLCMLPEVYREWKAALLKVCRETKNLCSLGQIKAIEKVGKIADDMILERELIYDRLFEESFSVQN